MEDAAYAGIRRAEAWEMTPGEIWTAARGVGRRMKILQAHIMAAGALVAKALGSKIDVGTFFEGLDD